ncbi:MAG: hypothetical protein H0W58_17775 [Acidobacteria bacterium]|jgi:hypothetical protein|nr:hypothetical protein [Acidobacteriota bacterium]
MKHEELNEKIGKLEEAIYKNHFSDTRLFTELTEIQSDLGLLYDNRPTCPFLRPHFLSRSQYDEIANAAEIIAEAFRSLAFAALDNKEILTKLDLTEKEERMARINPGYDKLCVTSRLDTFVAGSDFKFLEYNAETPAGVGDQMQLEIVLSHIPEIKDFLAENKHWRPKPHQLLLQSLFKTYREFGGRKGKPNIAIVDWDGVSTESEFYILKDYFESMGFKTLVADPHELEYDGGKLYAGDFEIDIFYKRVLIHEFLEEFDETHPFIRAYADGNIFTANSFRVKLAHKKASFAILTDEKYEYLFTPNQLEIIKKHIPWTRKVKNCKTKLDNKEIDLLEFLRANRETFLLKPNDDYGGKGIVLGWETSQSDWETALSEALQDSFIVQERAEIEKIVFPLFAEEVTMEELLVDFDPFLFLNKVEGGLVRLSSSSLVNITQGGGQTALIVLEDF